DRTVGLNDQLSRDVVVGRLGFGHARRGRRGMAGGERLDANSIADLQLVGSRNLFTRTAEVNGDHIALAYSILGHMRRAGMPHVLALGELLPGNHSAGIPANFAASASSGAIDAPNRERGRR